MSKFQIIAYDIVTKIYKALKNTSITTTDPIVNTFIYKNERINLDKEACEKAFKIITTILQEDEKNLIKKKQTTTKWEKVIRKVIYDAIMEAQNIEKSSISNFNGKEIFFTLLKEDHINMINTIIQRNIAYL
uniref:ORF11 n=1 Tax=Physarum polycephalum TaxID=5791 RepID=Q9MJ71_PHYPO|nr:hypothetical protein PhpooMp12 [Physarum polycephalum]BAB08091.1 unnamed protein product [Physarum polycephalum]